MTTLSNAINGDRNPLSEINEKELFEIYFSSRDKKVRNELVNRYLYIAEILSKKYVNRGIEYDDIYQVASIALIYAIERFDITRGFGFSSFATPTIIGEIKKHFRDKGWTIRVPRRIQEFSKKINNARNTLYQKLNRVPKVADIATFLECSEEEVLQAMEASQAYSPKSLDLTYDNNGDDKDLRLMDLIGEEEKSFSIFENQDFINKSLSKLDKTERMIVKNRFFENKTQGQVAKIFDVSQMTISRMEKKIIEKLRKETDKMM